MLAADAALAYIASLKEPERERRVGKPFNFGKPIDDFPSWLLIRRSLFVFPNIAGSKEDQRRTRASPRWTLQGWLRRPATSRSILARVD
jgi:hypothetical protein